MSHPGWLPNLQHAAYALFASAVFAAWLASPWAENGQPVVEDYFKILVFYFLVVTSVHDDTTTSVLLSVIDTGR